MARSYCTRWLAASFLIGLSYCNCVVAQGGEGPPVLLQGRLHPGYNEQGQAYLPQIISWPGSSIYATFQGAAALDINITAVAAASPQKSSNWLRIFIDNVFVRDVLTSFAGQQVNVIINTTAATHTIQIAKLSDPGLGTAVLNSILLSSGSFMEPMLPPALSSQKKILIIGDSYSVGAYNIGNLAGDACLPSSNASVPSQWLTACGNIPVPEAVGCNKFVADVSSNSLEAWGAKVARMFDADWQLIAVGGTGLVGYAYAEAMQIPESEWEIVVPSNALVFNRTMFADSTSTYNLSSWEPQVVIVAGGTNDWWVVDQPMYSLDDWVNTAADFIQEISEQLDEPEIIIQVWPNAQQNNLYADLALVDPSANATEYEMAADYAQAMSSLYTEVVERDVANVYYFQLTTDGYENLDGWCGRHPNIMTDSAIAEQLATFLSAVLPSWDVVNQLSTSENETAAVPDLHPYLIPAASSA